MKAKQEQQESPKDDSDKDANSEEDLSLQAKD